MRNAAAIIYIRVSTTEQADFGYSLKAQEQLCRDYAIRNNYDVLKIFTEKGESAKTTNRTELKSLLSYIRTNKNKIDALIIYKMDRLSRDIYDSLTIRLMLKKLNIDLKSVTEPFDDSPFGTFTATLFSSIAQLDNDIRSERTIMGMKQAVKEGRWIWQAPFGYTFKFSNNKSYLIPSKNSYIVKNIFKNFVNGKKQYEICQELLNSGIKFYKQKINNILKNPIYIGKIKSKFFNEPVNGIHERLIDETTFYKAQKILTIKGIGTYELKYENEFPLKRFLKCPECNKNLTGSYSKGRNKKYPYYHCTTKSCSFKPIRKEHAEDLFINYLRSFELKDKIINKIFDNLKSLIDKKQEDNKKTIANLKKEITLLEKKKERIEDLVIDGIFSKDTYLKKINDVQTEILTKKIQLSDYESCIINYDELIDYGREFLLNLSSLWLKLDNSNKRKLNSIFFPGGLYLENNEFRTAQISPILAIIQTQNDVKSNLAPQLGLEPFKIIISFNLGTLI